MSIASLSDLLSPETCPLLVVKVGSALLVGGGGKPREDWARSLLAEIAEARATGQKIVIVSSGAIALGAAKLGLPKGGRASLADAQAAAAVGQVALAQLWSGLLEERGLTAAQLLVTLEDLEDRRRYLNASATLGRLIDAGAIPVVNENDSVATEEIRFGDNDRLAARVAQAAGANAVVLLSDVDGLFDRDPSDQDAQLVRKVDGVTAETYAMASGGSSSGMGSGGMLSKLQAAEIAERAGIALSIVNGKHDRPLARAIDQARGTLFVPRRSDDARKSWLGGRISPAGTLIVDAGCADALRAGASVLAAGITAISGEFERGALVSITDAGGTPLAQGLSEYSAAECRAIKGLRAEDQADRLGFAPRSAVVHRNHLVML